MTHKKIKQTKLSFEMERCNNLLGCIEDADEKDRGISHVIFNQVQLKEETFSEQSFERVIFQDCMFENVSFIDCSFTNVLFLNSVFIDCSFSHSWFNQIKLQQSQYTKPDFSDGKFANITIDDCTMRYANFTFSTMENCGINASNLSDSFFTDCKLKNFFPHKTKFQSTDFFHTPLKDIDFTSCIIDGICVSSDWHELAGVVVNTYQAAELSKFLGITVKD